MAYPNIKHVEAVCVCDKFYVTFNFKSSVMWHFQKQKWMSSDIYILFQFENVTFNVSLTQYYQEN